MKHMKRALAVLFVLAMTVALVPAANTSAKAKKQITMSVTMEAGTTLQLSANGGKTYTWKSSKKSVATVSSKGLVTAKSTGSTNITVKDKKTGSKTTITIKVTAKSFQPRDMQLSGDGAYAWWYDESFDGATAYFDGKKIDSEICFNDRNYFMYFNTDGSPAAEGSHKLVFKKSGYQDYVFSFEYKKKTYSTLILTEKDDFGPFVYDGRLLIFFNPDVDGQNLTVKLDGIDVTSSGEQFMSGDGVYVFRYPLPSTGIPKGEHTITAKSDNHAEESITYTV